eukprot:3589416-Rhodomonas_salina.4
MAGGSDARLERVQGPHSGLCALPGQRRLSCARKDTRPAPLMLTLFPASGAMIRCVWYLTATAAPPSGLTRPGPQPISASSPKSAAETVISVHVKWQERVQFRMCEFRRALPRGM